MPRTPESLYTNLYLAVTQILANITGQFTAHDDGYLAAPDVPGLRVRLVLEIDPERAAGPVPVGRGWLPRQGDPPHDARLRPRPAPPVNSAVPATTVQRGLFDD